MADKRVRIELVKSLIGSKPAHRRTVKALGLGRMHSKREHRLTPSIQGMIRSISHMVKVEEIQD